MKILYPEVFWLLFILIVFLLPAFFNYRKGKQSLRRLGGSWRGEESLQVYFIKTLAYWLTIFLFFLFSVLALAGISWGKTHTKDESRGFDLVVAVDVSRSMLADDINPSRLSRAGESISFILNSFESIRTSLVVFKGEGEILVPLTEDSIQLEAALRSLSPDIYSVPGSDLEKGIRSALEAFPPGSPGKKVLLLVTDGETLEGVPRAAARDAILKDIPLFILGAGTPEGIILRDKNQEVIQDAGGQPVVTRLNPELLQDLADLSGGEYFSLSDPRALGEISDALRELTAYQDKEGIVYKDQQQYRIFVILALVALVLNLAFGGIRWSRWF